MPRVVVGEQMLGAQVSEDGTRRELLAAGMSWSTGREAQSRQRGASGRRRLGKRPWEGSGGQTRQETHLRWWRQSCR